MNAGAAAEKLHHPEESRGRELAIKTLAHACARGDLEGERCGRPLLDQSVRRLIRQEAVVAEIRLNGLPHRRRIRDQMRDEAVGRRARGLGHVQPERRVSTNVDRDAPPDGRIPRLKRACRPLRAMRRCDLLPRETDRERHRPARRLRREREPRESTGPSGRPRPCAKRRRGSRSLAAIGQCGVRAWTRWSRRRATASQRPALVTVPEQSLNFPVPTMQLSNTHCRHAGAVLPATHSVRQLLNEQLMTLVQHAPQPLLSAGKPSSSDSR